MRKIYSKIWIDDREKLLELVKTSTCLAEIVEKLGFVGKGNNCKALKHRLEDAGIDISHLKRQRWNLTGITRKSLLKEEAKKLYKIYETEKEYLSKKNGIKKYLKLFSFILSDKCAVCNTLPIWNNQILKFQLDHIDGNNKNNLVVNLRWICPNCHSQTLTFCGKHRRKPKPSEINPNWRHQPHFMTRKVQRPSKEELEKLVWEIPSSQLAKRFGVSDISIVKWCKFYGIKKPSRGYWTKIQISTH